MHPNGHSPERGALGMVSLEKFHFFPNKLSYPGIQRSSADAHGSLCDPGGCSAALAGFSCPTKRRKPSGMVGMNSLTAQPSVLKAVPGEC